MTAEELQLIETVIANQDKVSEILRLHADTLRALTMAVQDLQQARPDSK